MHILQALIMGIVQGLSEFLPISSSAHLVIASSLYKVFAQGTIGEHSTEEIFTDIMLHLGTLAAVLLFFRKDIMKIIKALFIGIKTKNFSTEDFKLGVYIMFGTVITVIIAYPLEKAAENLVFNPAAVGGLLFGTGLLLLGSEFYSKKIKEKSSVIDFKTSVLMAIAQGLAALPGFSRSGFTISFGLLCKKDRITAAKYSFLLSIPIILGASMVYPFISIDLKDFSAYNWTAIIIGTIASAISGYLCIKYFLKFIGKYSLAIFGYYCLIAGILSIGIFTILEMGL